MFILLPLSLIIFASGLAAYLLVGQMKLVRRGEVTVSVTPALVSIFSHRVNRFYHGFGFFFKHLGHHGYFFSLLVMRRLVIVSKYILMRIEQRFSHLIESVRGKGVISKRGSVSLFLTALASQEQVVAPNPTPRR